MSTIPVSPTTTADPATRQVVRHEQRHLAVQLTAGEMLARGQELANTIHEIAVEESRLVTLKTQAKARLEELSGRHERLASVVRAREEYRDVVVEVVFDYDAHHVRTVRPDTGEVVDQRAMTDDERQRRLFPDDDTPEASEASGEGDGDAEPRADHDDAGSSGDDAGDEDGEDEDDSRGPDDPPGEDDSGDAGPEADDQPHPDTAPAPARRASAKSTNCPVSTRTPAPSSTRARRSNGGSSSTRRWRAACP